MCLCSFFVAVYMSYILHVRISCTSTNYKYLRLSLLIIIQFLRYLYYIVYVFNQLNNMYSKLRKRSKDLVKLAAENYEENYDSDKDPEYFPHNLKLNTDR